MRSVIHGEWKESVTTRWVFVCVTLLPLAAAGRPQTPVDLRALFETGQLEREVQLAVEILMQPIVVARAVFEQEPSPRPNCQCLA